MDVYLLRHADAVDVGEQGAKCDAERALSKKGRLQSWRMGTALRRLDVKLDLVIVSPLARTRETAEQVLAVMRADVPVVCDNVMVPEGAPEEMWQAIRHAGVNGLLIVGHMPSIGRLAAFLLGQKPEEMAPQFRKATLASFFLESVGTTKKPSATLTGLYSASAIGKLLSATHSADDGD